MSPALSGPDAIQWIREYRARAGCTLREAADAYERQRPIPPAADDPWKAAVIDALVTAHIYTAEHESNPRGALNALLAYEQAVALDPAVSSDAAALIERGRAEADACVAALRKLTGLAVARRDGDLVRIEFVMHADAIVALADARAALRAYDERSGA